MRAQPQPAIESAATDPTGHYEIIKKFRANADHYKFYKEVFDKLPGHAATLKYTLKENKATGKTEPFWVIQNNVTLDEGAGWQRLCSAARMPRRPRSIWRDPPRKCAS